MIINTEPVQARLAGIQVLRGIAVLMVVFHHYAGTALERGFALPGLERVAIGNAGVDLFFVISGFIMEYMAGARPPQRGDRRRFLLRRMVRILPLYWLLTALAFGAALLLPGVVNSPVTGSLFLWSMLLLPDPASPAVYVIPMAWTLTYELYFYLLFALLLGCRPGLRLILLLLCFVPALLVEDAWTAGRPLLGMMLNPILFEFAAGVWLAQLARHAKPLNDAMRAALPAVAGAILLAQLNMNITESLSRLFGWGMPAVLLVAGVVLHRQGNHGGAMHGLERIGDLSYSLYLSHFFAIALFAKFHSRFGLHSLIPAWLSGLALFLTCLLIAQLCYRLIEKPARDSLSLSFRPLGRQHIRKG
jgi:exopolysaccharide production protein ExoZ